MHEVTCPVYPCGWSVVVNDAVLELAAADIAFRVHLRSHDASEIVAGFEALTAQNTRQLAHLGELNDELLATRKRMASENARLRVQRDDARDQWNRECARANSLVEALARLAKVVGADA